MSNADQYLSKAKQLVADEAQIQPEELYVVWFCKTLGNWKALVSTDEVSGAYWEVTYNGAKQEAYVDTYTKTGNVAVPDA